MGQSQNYSYENLDDMFCGQRRRTEIKSMQRPLPWHLENPGWFAVIVGSFGTFAMRFLTIGLPDFLK